MKALKTICAIVLPAILIVVFMFTVILFGANDWGRYVSSVAVYFAAFFIAGKLGSPMYRDSTVIMLGFVPAFNLFMLYACGVIWLSELMKVDVSSIFLD